MKNLPLLRELIDEPRLALVFEARKASTVVVTLGASVVSQLEGFAADLLVLLNFGHVGGVVGAPLCGSLV